MATPSGMVANILQNQEKVFCGIGFVRLLFFFNLYITNLQVNHVNLEYFTNSETNFVCFHHLCQDFIFLLFLYRLLHTDEYIFYYICYRFKALTKDKSISQIFLWSMNIFLDLIHFFERWWPVTTFSFVCANILISSKYKVIFIIISQLNHVELSWKRQR